MEMGIFGTSRQSLLSIKANKAGLLQEGGCTRMFPIEANCIARGLKPALLDIAPAFAYCPKRVMEETL